MKNSVLKADLEDEQERAMHVTAEILQFGKCLGFGEVNVWKGRHFSHTECLSGETLSSEMLQCRLQMSKTQKATRRFDPPLVNTASKELTRLVNSDLKH